MEHKVVRVIAHHICSPLADGSQENYRLVKAGKPAVSQHRAEEWELAEDFMVGLMKEPIAEPRAVSLAMKSLRGAVSKLKEPLPVERTLFILSTTKGNVELLDKDLSADISLSTMAAEFSRQLGLTMKPLVVSNACTSGVCAQIAASRALQSGICDYAVVCGVEAQSRFIVSGFQSFHALSPEGCRPFSKNRVGLNAGEAAATIIYTLSDAQQLTEEDWTLRAGAIRNDANHISGPSRVGEGSFRALRAVMTDVSADELAFVSVHGTATSFNDEMESIAISRAGLIDVPICSLKGYYGHTMGAAGVLETIISMEAVEDNNVPATYGYDGELGVSHPVKVSNENRPTTKRSFIKLISGFGGCNAAIRMQKGGKA